MPRIVWADGRIDHGDTWEALFDRIRLDQWYPYTRQEFRWELAHRALVWDKVIVDGDLPLPELFAALAEAHMLRIEEGEI